MLKIRMQGTKRDIHWFQRLMEQEEKIHVLRMSEIFSNKGTDKYFRAYAEVEQEEK